jgi:hypothetical protein
MSLIDKLKKLGAWEGVLVTRILLYLPVYKNEWFCQIH